MMGKRTGIRPAQQSAHNEKEQAEKNHYGFCVEHFYWITGEHRMSK